MLIVSVQEMINGGRVVHKKSRRRKMRFILFLLFNKKIRNLTYTRHTADTILLMQDNVSRFSSLSFIGLSQKYVKSSYYYAKVSSATDIHM